MSNRLKFEDIIERDGRLIYTNVGNSMEPLICQGRDLIVIEKPSGRLKKYDIAMYRRKSGQCVLHRIVKVKKNSYVACGDNQIAVECGIEDNQVIGVMKARISDDKILLMDSFTARIYAHLWCDFFMIRIFLLKLKRMVNKIANRRYKKRK